MRFIVNGTMAVETGKIRPVSRVLETLYVNLKGALFAAFLVTTNTILWSVSHGTKGGKKNGNKDDGAQLQPDRAAA